MKWKTEENQADDWYPWEVPNVFHIDFIILFWQPHVLCESKILTKYLLHNRKITKQNRDATCHSRRQSGHEPSYKTLSVWKLLHYLKVILRKKIKRITIVLSDWCFRFRQKMHWACWDSALLLTNTVVYISAIRTSHNRLLTDFSSSKGNLNNPWVICSDAQTHCNYWYFYAWCYQRLKK